MIIASRSRSIERVMNEARARMKKYFLTHIVKKFISYI